MSRKGVALVASVVVIAIAALWTPDPEDDVPGAGSMDSTTGGATDATGATAATIETPEAFLPAFSRAIRDGDREFLFERLHPAVIDFYSVRTCRVYLRDFVVPNSDFVFRSAAQPAEFTWVVDGRATSVQDVVNVEVTAVTEEGEIDRVIHLGIVEGGLRWFADCGDPAM